MRTNRVFQVVYKANIDCNKLKVRKFDGKDWLVGPVVMAKEIVMNGILYPAKELAKGVPAWNFRPITVGHPKDEDGNYLSANSPDVLDKVGIGHIFHASFNEDTAKLKAEAWLDPDKVKKFPKVNDKIEAKEMLEVSTGLFLDRKVEEGEFNGRDYDAIGVNHRPDHLAFLPDEIGACSVEDGAGFPRANQLEIMQDDFVAGNDRTMSEKFSMVSAAVHKVNKGQGNIEDMFDNHVIFSIYNSTDNVYELYRTDYKLSKDEKQVNLKGEPVRVLRKVTYEDAPATNNTKKKEVINMTRKEQVDALVSNGTFAEKDRESLMGLSEEVFAAVNVVKKVETPPAANTKVVTPEVKTPVVPEMNAVEKDQLEHSKKLYEDARSGAIATIKANKVNPYTDDDLAVMTLNQLGKLSKLAAVSTAVDMSGRGGAGGIADNASDGAEEAPLV